MFTLLDPVAHWFIWEKTVTSNTSISNLENFNLENESGELKVSRELKDGMAQYRFLKLTCLLYIHPQNLKTVYLGPWAS
jgi:hypothetical protein